MVWDVIQTLLLDPKSTKSFFTSVSLKHHAVAAFTIPRGFSFFAVITEYQNIFQLLNTESYEAVHKK